MEQATRAAASQYATNAEGERIVPGSRRADGTIRKERRVRAGYVAPEEQKSYVSRGMQFRREADQDKCPGFAEEVRKPAATPLSKSAKKNAARKAKGPASDATHALTSLSLSDASRPDPHAAHTHAPQAGAAAPTVGGADAGTGGMPTAVKKLRALQKKVRQCQVLLDRQDAGDTMTVEEQAKIASMGAWLAEIDQLEVETAGINNAQ